MKARLQECIVRQGRHSSFSINLLLKFESLLVNCLSYTWFWVQFQPSNILFFLTGFCNFSFAIGQQHKNRIYRLISMFSTCHPVYVDMIPYLHSACHLVEKFYQCLHSFKSMKEFTTIFLWFYFSKSLYF